MLGQATQSVLFFVRVNRLRNPVTVEDQLRSRRQLNCVSE